MTATSLETGARPSTTVAPLARAARVVRAAGVVLALASATGGILVGRGWRPWSPAASGNVAPVAAGMPSSAAIEGTYGIRISSVAITAGNGIAQVRFQVLDSDKAQAIHDATVTPVIIGPDGTTYADEGLAGHSHKSVPDLGRAGYVMIANRGGGIRPGMVVTVRVGDLELRGVPVD